MAGFHCTCCVRFHTLLHVVACCCEEFKTGYYLQTDATAPDNVGCCWPTMLPPFARASVLYFIFRAYYFPLFQNTLSEISAAGAQYSDASVYGRQRLSTVMKPKDKLWETFQLTRGGGYSHTLPIRVCAAQRGRDFEAPGLERGIHFRGVF